MAEGSKRVAVIDIGTNSARLLVADVEGGRVSPVERRSTVTRLGRGVDLSGRLSAEAIEDACAAIADYVGHDRGARRRGGRRDRDQRRPRRRERQRLRRRAARALRALGPRPRRRGGGAPHLPRRHRASTAGAADPGRRHRRRLDRVGRRHRLGDLLPHFAAGWRRPPQRAPRRLRPADRGRARSAGRRRPRPDRGGGRRARPRRRAPGSPSPAPPPRWPRSSWSSSPTTRRRSTATRSRSPSIQRMLSQLAAKPLAERRPDPRPAPRPGADDRRRRRHPDPGDARLRARARSRSPSTTSSTARRSQSRVVPEYRVLRSKNLGVPCGQSGTGHPARWVMPRTDPPESGKVRLPDYQ